MIDQDKEMSKESQNILDKKFSRRDFLKFSLMAGGVAALNKPGRLLDFAENLGVSNWPEIDMNQLPENIQNILETVLPSRVNSAGVVEISDKDPRVFSKVPVIQTEINRKNLELAKENLNFLCPNTAGIVFHSFDATDYLLKTYMPNGTAKEYVENGFGSLTSAMFLVGDAPFDSSKDLVNSAPSIVQCELPSPDGRLVPSAHVSKVSQEEEYVKKQPFVQSMYRVCNQFGFDSETSVLQTVHQKGWSPSPNRSTMGIEITGIDFDQPGNFPADKKISSVVTLASALVKKYKICPAYDFFGHREFDLGKADPGRRLTYLMKVLVGVECLINKDEELKNVVFGPFVEKSASKIGGVQKYFDFITTYFRISSDASEAEEYLKKIGYDKILAVIKNADIAEKN
jgi:hypothetical protein